MIKGLSVSELDYNQKIVKDHQHVNHVIIKELSVPKSSDSWRIICT